MWHLAVILALTGTAAVRHSDLDPDALASSGCAETCVSPSGRSGFYELRGEASRSGRLGEAESFVSSSCEAPGATASIVPWIDAEDPVNGSFVAVFADPVQVNRLRQGSAHPLKLCVSQPNEAVQCVCELSGERPLSVLGRVATMLPQSGKPRDFQLYMERCPERVPDLLAGTLLVSFLLVSGVWLWALWKASASASGSEPLAAEPEAAGVVQVKTPLQNFVSGFSWAAGFLLSLVAMQTGALSFVQKSSEQEEAVWLVAALPIALTLAATLRLMQLLAKKQLAHAFLDRGVVPTDLPHTGSFLDGCLVLAVLAYLLLVVFLVSIDVATLLVALTALGGSAWMLLKAVSTAREMEQSLKLVEVSSSLLADAGKPRMRALSWESLSSKSLEELRHVLSGSSASPPAPGTPASQGALVHFLSRSYAGFLILPSFLALVASSWCISATYMTVYACSAGELTQLTPASSIHSLSFAPWQTYYEVITDVSFQQMALMASVQPSRTRSMSFGQPAPTSGPSSPRLQIPIEENHSAVVVEIQLAQRQVPRVASFHVKGLRPSLPETKYQVRFSPFQTLPTALRLSSESSINGTRKSFQRTLAWSSLPGSVISVPSVAAGYQGSDLRLRVEVVLTDFVLGLPSSKGDTPVCGPQGSELKTLYREVDNVSDSLCSQHCGHRLDCFESYPAARGCFLVLGDRQCWEAPPDFPGTDTEEISPGRLPVSSASARVRSPTDRRLQGRLSGCKLSEAEEGADGSEVVAATPCGGSVEPEPGKSLLPFGEVRPDWRAGKATLNFALELEMGGQRFDADFTTIAFHQGPPRPADAMALLLGDHAEAEEGIAVLRSESSVDAEGNILVKLFEYDPKSFRSLRLLVMPMVADPAFRANWSDWIPASDLDRKFLREHDRCLESGLVRSRYAVCGADDGIASGIALSDQPFIVPVPLFNSQPAALPTFTIVPRKGALKAVEGWEWASQQHSVIINFDAVDSPAAWAAHKHGCSLLNETAAERGIFASADATCQLLSECPSEELCTKVRTQTMGGRSATDTSYHDFNEGREPNQTMLLSPEGAVKLLLCLRTRAPDCSEDFERKRKWLYDTGSRSIHLGKAYALKVPMETLLEHADRLRNLAGLSLLNEIRRNLTAEDAEHFDEDAAAAVWQLPEPSADLLTTLATLVQEERRMPKLLAQSLMRSPSPKLPPETSQLKAAFADLTVLEVNLDDAAQLSRLATLAQLASRLLNLQLFCTSCPGPRKVPTQEGLRGLSTHRELRFLRLESFQLQSLPADVFWSLGRLDGLMLQNNALERIRADVFHGLQNLTQLNLKYNQLVELPKGVFDELKELKTLRLDYNQLSQLPSGLFEHLGVLKMLHLSSNPLQSLPADAFIGLRKLKGLMLNSDQLKSLQPKAFRGLDGLKGLHLNSNQLRNLSAEVFEGLGQLTMLRLSSNQLESLPADVFKHLPRLEQLKLSSNHLQRLPAELFRNLERLMRLDLSSNPFRSLPEILFQPLRRLKSIHLNSNHLEELPKICKKRTVKCFT